jgi:hypothetical protein
MTPMGTSSPRIAISLAIASLLLAWALPAGAQRPVLKRAEQAVILLEAVERGDPVLDAIPGYNAVELLLAELDEYIVDHPDDVAALLLAVRLGRFMFREAEEDDGMPAPVGRDLARIDRVLELQPSSALAHYLQASLLARAAAGPLGLFDAVDAPGWEVSSREAIEPARRAVELDPGAEDYRRLLRDLLQLHGHFDEARAAGITLPHADEWNRVAAPFEAFAFPPGGTYWTYASAGVVGVALVGSMMMGGATTPRHPGAHVRVYFYPLPLDTVLELAREALGDQAAFRTPLEGKRDEEDAGARAMVEAFVWSGDRLVRRPHREDGDSPPLVVLFFEHPVDDDDEPFSFHGPLPLPRLPDTLRERFELQDDDHFSVLVAVSGWRIL